MSELLKNGLRRKRIMNTVSKIAVIGAMECEIEEIKQQLSQLKEVFYADLKIFTGKINNFFVILSQSGVGKVNSALNTQYIIDTFKPDIIINTGVAGGVDKILKIGDIVIATSLVQHDFDVSVLGYAKGYMCTGQDKDKPTKFYCDNDLINKFENALQKNDVSTKIHKGIIASGDTFVSDKKQKEEINSYFGALAVEMEGAAIAQVATRNKVPFVVTRTISDLADGTATEYQNEFEKTFSRLSAETLKVFLKDYN